MMRFSSLLHPFYFPPPLLRLHVSSSLLLLLPSFLPPPILPALALHQRTLNKIRAEEKGIAPNAFLDGAKINSQESSLRAVCSFTLSGLLFRLDYPE